MMKEGLGKREAGGGGTVVVGAPYFCHSKSNPELVNCVDADKD